MRTMTLNNLIFCSLYFLIALLKCYSALGNDNHEMLTGQTWLKQESFIVVCCYQGEGFDINLVKCVKNAKGENQVSSLSTNNSNKLEPARSKSDLTTTITASEIIETDNQQMHSQILIPDPITKSNVEPYKVLYFKTSNETPCPKNQVLFLKSAKHVFTNGSVVLEENDGDPESVPYLCLDSSAHLDGGIVVVCRTKQEEKFAVSVFTIFDRVLTISKSF
jgi:hypothetical protein